MLDDAFLQGEVNDACFVFQVQLFHRVLAVPFNGEFADAKNVRDFFIRLVLRDEPEDLKLPV